MKIPARLAWASELDRRFVVAAAAVGLLLLTWLTWTWLTWPDVSALEAANPQTTAFI